MACIAFETVETFSASVKNPHSSATGLIQFMEQTALDLGTSTAALALLDAEDQINVVWKYFRAQIRAHGQITNLADCYMAIFLPSAMGKPLTHPLFIRGNRAYAVNSGLDTDKDATITKGEAAALVQAKLTKGLRPENVATY